MYKQDIKAKDIIMPYKNIFSKSLLKNTISVILIVHKNETQCTNFDNTVNDNLFSFPKNNSLINKLAI